MSLLALLLSFALPPQKDHPVTYLISVEIPLGEDERVSSFAFESWGVQYDAVCRIPDGWRIKAGSSATPDGNLEGEGSHGATWIGRESMGQLRNLALVTLFAPVQREQEGMVPPTFSGHATIEDSDDSRQIPIGADAIRLMPASGCP